jgi:hypothetical protein
MSDDDSFVDARLYITIRPPLEYQIIEMGQHAVVVMVGDEETEYRYTNVSHKPDASLTFASLRDARLDTTCSLCISVCSMTEEYLRCMEMEWIDFLSRIHAGIRNELRGVRNSMDIVLGIRERYGALRNTDVDHEISVELNRLHELVNDILDRYRTAEKPQVRRSDELRSATIKLRREFGEMYGSIPTTTLVRVKQIFEGEMMCVQQSISRSFDRRLRELVRRPI